MARPSKYDEIAAQLQQRIAGGAYSAGQPLPPEQELARQFNVHRMTLRKALDVLERDQLIVRRHGCGTFATPPPQDKHRLTTVLYVGRTQGHFYDRLYQALSAEVQDRGRVIKGFMPDSALKKQQLKDLAEASDQIICQDDFWPDVRQVVGDDIPLVRISGYYGLSGGGGDEHPHYAISTDLFRAVKAAVDHLVELGHRRLAFLDAAFTSVPGAKLASICSDHLPWLAYSSTLAHHELDYRCGIGIADRGADDEWQTWYGQCVEHYLDGAKELPTAIICNGDFRAAPLLRTLRARGLSVPGDISVIGIGNTPWAEMLDVPLSSVCMGETEMARIALLLGGEPEPRLTRCVYVEPRVIVRQTTTPPK